MTGKVIDGREAHRIGFANRIGPAESLDELTESFAGELLACAPARGRAREAGDGRRRQARAREHAGARGNRSGDAGGKRGLRRGARAFFEKRNPEFAGR